MLGETSFRAFFKQKNNCVNLHNYWDYKISTWQSKFKLKVCNPEIEDCEVIVYRFKNEAEH